MPFTVDSYVVASDEQVHTSLGDEAVILGLEDGVYYGLDAVGARLWALLATPRRVSDLVALVMEEFDVGEERCEHDVLALLGELAERRLIREAPEGGNAGLS
jgi:coenzyme PQQ synthesis protein D (PqqD)